MNTSHYLAQYCPTPPSEPAMPSQGLGQFTPAHFNGTVRLNKPGIHISGKCLGQQGVYARFQTYETPPSCPNISVSAVNTYHGQNGEPNYAELWIHLRGPMPNNTFWMNMTFSQEITSWHEFGRDGGKPFHVSNGTYNAFDGEDLGHFQYVYGIHDVQHLTTPDRTQKRSIKVRYV